MPAGDEAVAEAAKGADVLKALVTKMGAGVPMVTEAPVAAAAAAAEPHVVQTMAPLHPTCHANLVAAMEQLVAFAATVRDKAASWPTSDTGEMVSWWTPVSGDLYTLRALAENVEAGKGIGDFMVVAKAAVEKAGRKIAAHRLERIRRAAIELQALIDEVEAMPEPAEPEAPAEEQKTSAVAKSAAEAENETLKARIVELERRVAKSHDLPTTITASSVQAAAGSPVATEQRHYQFKSDVNAARRAGARQQVQRG